MRSKLITRTVNCLQGELSSEYVVASSPDHPFLYSGPDILIGGNGGLVAVFFPKTNESHNQREFRSRIIASRLALPTHARLIAIATMGSERLLHGTAHHFDEIFQPDETNRILKFISSRELGKVDREHLSSIRSTAMSRYSVALELSKRSISFALREDDVEASAGVSDFIADLPTVVGFKHIHHFNGRWVAGVGGKNKRPVIKDVSNCSISSLSRDYSLDNGVPYPVLESPNVFVIERFNRSSFDPVKPIRCAAFAGWVVQTPRSAQHLIGYMDSLPEAFDRLIAIRAKGRRS